MYDEVLAFTGVGALTLGPIVTNVWWVALVCVVAGLCAVVGSRLACRPATGRHRR